MTHPELELKISIASVISSISFRIISRAKTLLKMDGKIKLNNPLITKTNILARDHLKAFDLIIDKF